MRLGWLLLVKSALCLWVRPNGWDNSSCGSNLTPCRTLEYAWNRQASGPVGIELFNGTFGLTEPLQFEKRNVTIRAASSAIINLGPHYLNIHSSSVEVANVVFQATGTEKPLFEMVSQSNVRFDGCWFLNTSRSIFNADHSELELTNSTLETVENVASITYSSLRVDHCRIVSEFPNFAGVFEVEKSEVLLLESKLTVTNGLAFLLFVGSGVVAQNTIIRSLHLPKHDNDPRPHLAAIASDTCPFSNTSGLQFIVSGPDTLLLRWSMRDPPCSILDSCSNCSMSGAANVSNLTLWRQFGGLLETSNIASINILPPGIPTSLVSGVEFSFTVSFADIFGNPSSTYVSLSVNGTKGAALTGRGNSVLSTVGGQVTFSSLALTGAPGIVTLYLTNGVTYDNLPTASSTFQVSAAVTLLPCAVGFGFVTSATTCERCPLSTYNRVGGSVCTPCPDGATCPGGEDISVNKGWAWVGDSCTPTLVSCFREDDCCASGNCPIPSCGTLASWDNFSCGANRHGILCTQCVTGYAEWAGQCADCRGGSNSMLAAVFLVPVIVIQLVLFLNALRTQDAHAQVGLVVLFYQVAALLLTGSDTLAFASWAILSMPELLDNQRGCVLDVTPLQKVALSFIGPLCPFVYSFVLLIVLLLLPEKWRSRLLLSIGMVPAIMVKVFILVSYLPLTKVAFSLFVCKTVVSTEVLAVSPAVECWTGDHTLAGICGIVLFALLLLLPFAVLLFTRRLLRMHSPDDLDSPVLMKKHGQFYAAYRDVSYKAWFYPLTMLQSLLLSTIPSLTPGRTLQLCVSIVLLAAFYLFQVSFLPHRHRDDRLRAQLHFFALIIIGIVEMIRKASPAVVAFQVVVFVLPAVTLVIRTSFLFVQKKLANRKRKAYAEEEGGPKSMSKPAMELPQSSERSLENSNPPSLAELSQVSTNQPYIAGREKPRSSLPVVAALMTQVVGQVYVHPLGADLGMCSIGFPCLTFSYAVTQISSGNAVVFAGPGRHFVQDDLVVDATSYSSFRIASLNVTDRATVEFDSGVASWQFLNCASCSVEYITFASATLRSVSVLSSRLDLKDCDFLNSSHSVACGGAVFADSASSVTINRCNFVNNTASRGGAVCFGLNLVISGSHFSECSAGIGGAISDLNTTTTSPPYASVRDTTIDHCSATLYGGGMAGNLNVSLSNVTLTSNTAESYGGCFRIWGGALVGDSCTISDNWAEQGPVGYFSRSIVKLFNSRVLNNGDDGTVFGALFLGETQLVLFSCLFSGNSAVQGPVIATYGSIATSHFITDSLFTENSGTYGAVIDHYGTTNLFLSVVNSEFIGNRGLRGGVIYGAKKNLVQFETTNFTSNTATSGGVAYEGNISFSFCRFHNNSAISCGVVNLVASGSQVTVNDSTFTNNSATDKGGVMCLQTSESEIQRSNFSFNSAAGSFSSLGNGGVFNLMKGNASLSVDLCSFKNNFAGSGGVVELGDEGSFYGTRSEFISNHAETGGVVVSFQGFNFFFYKSVFKFNSAETGGVVRAGRPLDCAIDACQTIITCYSGVCLDYKYITTGHFERCDFLSNSATFRGGAVMSLAQLKFTDCFFLNNSAPTGGAMMLGGVFDLRYDGFGDPFALVVTARLISTDFSNVSFINNAAEYGGAIAFGVGYGNTSLRRCSNLDVTFVRFENNVAVRGAAVFWAQPFIEWGNFFDPDCCENCRAIGPPLELSGQRYNNYQSTAVSKISVIRCPLQTGPGVPFDCILEMQDKFGVPVFEAVFAVLMEALQVNVSGANCTLSTANGLFTRYSEQGRVAFRPQLFGSIGAVCHLSFKSLWYNVDRDEAMDGELSHNITILECPPNWILVGDVCQHCPTGTFRLSGETCRACLPLMTCDLVVSVERGYWPIRGADGEPQFVKCVDDDVCCPLAQSCPFNLEVLPDLAWSQCAHAHTGPLCGQCLSGFVKWGGQCVDCSSLSWGYGIFLFILSLLVPAFLLMGPKKPEESNLEKKGWTPLYPQFVNRVLLLQSLAAILRFHSGSWNFVHIIEIASLNLDMGPAECMGNFSPLGRIVAGVMFPVLMFPWVLLLSCMCRSRKLASRRDCFMTLLVLSLQPCLRSSSILVSCVKLGTQNILPTSSEECYTGIHLAAAVPSWILLGNVMLLVIFSLASVSRPVMSMRFPSPEFLHRLLGHLLVTIIASCTLVDREAGIVVLATVALCTRPMLGIDQRQGSWILNFGCVVLVLASVIEYQIAIDRANRRAGLVMLAILVALCVAESCFTFVFCLKHRKTPKLMSH